MTFLGWLTKIFMPWFLRLVFALHLRKPWSLFVRWLQNEKARADITQYLSPGAIEDAMKFFQYRHDPLGGQVDYVSHPEYVQAMLNNRRERDGDCDDGHWYVANALKPINGVEAVYLLSSGFSSKKAGKTSAHCTCVYKYHGNWYHYDWANYPIADPNDAPKAVAKRYTKDPDAGVTYWVWESVGESGNDRSGWQLIGINTALKI